MLEMLPHRRARGFWLFSTTKPVESDCGADLLVILRHRTRRWSSLAIQAKKLYSNDRYQTMGGSDSIAQLGRLELFARQLRALPLYLLYNHTDAAHPKVHWHCRKCFAADQLGCTLVPSWHIHRMVQPWTARNFDLAHSVRESMPWRCAFDCPVAEWSIARLGFSSRAHYPDDSRRAHMSITREYEWRFEPLEAAWPEWLFDKHTSVLTKEEFERFRSELSGVSDSAELHFPNGSSRRDGPLYPERLLIVDQLE